MNRLRLHILRDEINETWDQVKQCFVDTLPKRYNSVGVGGGDIGRDADGRVWVEVGGSGLKLRVTHLHPANPNVAQEVIDRINRYTDETLAENNVPLPSEDEISLSSLEDYWFNHWEGPYITADSNQNNTFNARRSRQSLRKSKRRFRCSICHKKLAGVEGAPNASEGTPHCTGKNILAHVPSVKPDTRTPKNDDSAAGSSDDEGMNRSHSDELLSSYSASDEQLARAHRIWDNELRTSFSLFAEDTVTQDVVDSVCMDNSSGFPDDISERLTAAPHSPARQSRSCPCSPKLSGMRNHSPKSNSNSPKPRSSSSSSRFSLSNSLMAIHRQASNTLRPDFLSRSDVKPEGTHNSLRYESQHSGGSQKGDSHLCISTPDHDHNDQCCIGASATKNALQESISLPTLKLSKMALIYKGGQLVQGHLVHQESAEQESHTPTPCQTPTRMDYEETNALASSTDDGIQDLVPAHQILPDVVPRQKTSSLGEVSTVENWKSNPGSSSSPNFYYTEDKKAFINLGFDGHEESSDFQELNEIINSRMDGEASESSIEVGGSSVSLNVDAAHAISIAHYSTGQEAAMSLEVPHVTQPDDICETSSLSSSSTLAVDMVQDASVFVEPVPLCDIPIGPPLAPAHLLVEDPPSLQDPLQEPRESVYWWHTKSGGDSEFCDNHTECRVKQKPLLLFLHGLGGSSDQWRQQLWYFVSCGYEVVAPDLLGHGLSSAPDESELYVFNQMLEFITLVFDFFVPQGRKCVVIGHGYGCSLGAALARGRPLSVRLVILASCGGPSPLIPNPAGASVVKATLSTILGPFMAVGCCSRELLYSPRGKHFAVANLMGSSITPTPRYVIEHVAQGQDWPEGDVAFHRRITVPTLLLYGMKDTRVSLVEMCEMERTIPRAFLELIPSAGHDIMTDAPLEVCHALHRFIKRWKQCV
ncbi:unnamed protein product [Meganyctiphanes norvegica]|uniref:acylglycerol lipase n=1 Tax=Meganyctiphanes norvegica TaxID=48144 RepID=A0AAV2PRE9_MEGNR